MKINFYKYQGTGNDFVMVDDRSGNFKQDTILIEHLCNRRFGIGADGLILLQSHPDADFYMQYYNSDGRESSMCGNGGRCIARFAKDLEIAGDKTIFYAMDGYHEATFETEHVSLLMKNVETIEKRTESAFVLDTGSPHYVVFCQNDIESIDLIAEAKAIRYNDEFKSAGINVNFVTPVEDDVLKIRTYERGVEDETYSCGTGVTASALAYAVFRNNPSGPQQVLLQSKGGPLRVTFNFESNRFTDVWLIGPAERVFEGSVEI